jgi:hypothetical protein
MAKVYARGTDAGFATAFSAAVTATQVVGTVPGSITGPELQKGIAAASATIFGAVNIMPDTLWVSPDVWAYISGLADTTGRPLFSTIGPMNAAGALDGMSGNVYGLRLVVDMFLPAQSAIVGVSGLAEFYEQVGGQLSVTEPSILGFVVAYYGYVAWCFPAPTGFVKLTGILAETAEASAAK